MFRSRLKSLVKRVARAQEPPPVPAPRAAAVVQPALPTGGFAALAAAASEGTLEQKLDELEAQTWNNESSQAFADGRVLTIDQDECISCGTCVENSEPNFFLPSEGRGGEAAKAQVIAQNGNFEHIQDAIDACPVMCIDWLGKGDIGPNHSAGGR